MLNISQKWIEPVMYMITYLKDRNKFTQKNGIKKGLEIITQMEQYLEGSDSARILNSQDSLFDFSVIWYAHDMLYDNHISGFVNDLKTSGTYKIHISSSVFFK